MVGEPDPLRFASGRLRRSAVASEVIAVDDIRVPGIPSPAQLGGREEVVRVVVLGIG